MTIGEKIQYYRKSLKLSQEELGKKLCISRQTISLWEKAQTLPTIDNLIRLKEIFGVSFDELMGEDKLSEKSSEQIRGSYTFRYTKEEILKIYRLATAPMRSKIVTIAVVFAGIWLFMSVIDSSSFWSGLILCLALFLLLEIRDIRTYFTNKKVWENAADKISESVYEYEIYDKDFKVFTKRNGETVSMTKVEYSEVSVSDYGEYFILVCRNQLYIIKNEQLENGSIFSNELQKKTTNKYKPKDMWDITAMVLFAASIFSIFAAMMCVDAVSGANGMGMENMWIFFLFVPIPVSSVILGYYLKAKGYKAKKNIIAGIIMAVLLCGYGSFTFIFSDVYTHDDSYVVKVEEYLGMDIPEHREINTQDWTKGTQTSSREYYIYTADIYFDSNNAEELEREIASNSNWISEVPSELHGVMSTYGGLGGYDYTLLYNMDDGEYNSLPHESGTYRFVNVMYFVANEMMMVIEYEIEYIE